MLYNRWSIFQDRFCVIFAHYNSRVALLDVPEQEVHGYGGDMGLSWTHIDLEYHPLPPRVWQQVLQELSGPNA